MGDAQLSCSRSERGRLLAKARAALGRCDRREMQELLELLPQDSRKMQAARRRLVQRLADTANPIVEPAVESNTKPHEKESEYAGRASEGYGLPSFEISLADSDFPLLAARRFGTTVEICVCRRHPLVREECTGAKADELCEASRVVLAAWAVLEMEAGTQERRDRIEETRIEFERVLARVAGR